MAMGVGVVMEVYFVISVKYLANLSNQKLFADKRFDAYQIEKFRFSS